MTARRPLAAVLALVLLLPALAFTSGHGERLTLGRSSTLHTEPDGEPWAVLPAGVQVDGLERQQGWMRVRLEGWVPDAQAAAGTTAPAAPAEATPGEAAPAASATPAALAEAAAPAGASHAHRLPLHHGVRVAHLHAPAHHRLPGEVPLEGRAHASLHAELRAALRRVHHALRVPDRCEGQSSCGAGCSGGGGGAPGTSAGCTSPAAAWPPWPAFELRTRSRKRR